MRGWMAALMMVGMAAGAGAQHVFFKVTLSKDAPGAVSGRVLVFVKAGHGDKEVDTNEFNPTGTWVAAREVKDLAPGESVEVDGASSEAGVAFPRSFLTMPAGEYEAQAVLDTGHTYNYSGRGVGDLLSEVVGLGRFVPGSGTEPVLTLAGGTLERPGKAEAEARMAVAVKAGFAEKVEMESAALTKFWGRPTYVRSWVVLPPGYREHVGERYPTAYWTAGFGGALESGLAQGLRLRERMSAGKMPPMIWVMLDESCAHGTHEFADSVNNGPWGKALTAEYIPMLEQRYRMDGRREGRLLNGHSSGGWATLQLQVNYPEVFGGTWSTSPDSSDFHDFSGPDLYAAGASVYRKADGTAYPIMRVGGKVMATLEEFAKLESVLGEYGGQMRSFDWVFSPRGEDGAPMAMFDRETGVVDAGVMKYWGEHYELATIAEREWGAKGALLKGRIHVYVGTADTFYLDGAAHRLDARLKKLGAGASFHYVEGRSHFDVYGVGEDRMGLFDEIGAQMWAVARSKK